MNQTHKIGSAVLAVTFGLMTGCSSVSPLASTVGSALNSMSAGTSGNSVGIEASKFGPDAKFIPGEMIVKFKDSRAAAGSMSRLGLTRKKEITAIGVTVVTTEDDVLAAVRKASADPSVLYAEPNYIARISDAATEAPNDPDFAKQYAPQITKAVEGWKITQGNPDTILAIVDTGIDADHPDLKGKVLPGFDTIDGDNNPRDGHGHGTHCAGIAAALTNNKTGIAGIAPANKIFSVRVLDDNGSGSYANVALGITKAADMGAKVISMSLGGPTSSKEIEDAVKYAISKDVLVVAATGNDGAEKVSYPAGIAGVMPIGSSDDKDKRSSFSNWGKHISVVAPGSKIWSTLPTYKSAMGQNYGFASGTSMATPAAAGLAILVRSQFPAFDYKATRAKIEASADDINTPGFDIQTGYGRINVLKALSPSRR
ncbi:MAG: peptidase S8 [Candidatus Sericytochromatia bacterium]|nr:peptidase S8 [Candidatus Sericytochromatia bacterium]